MDFLIHLLVILSSPSEVKKVTPPCEMHREALSIEKQIDVAFCCSQVGRRNVCTDKKILEILGE